MECPTTFDWISLVIGALAMAAALIGIVMSMRANNLSKSSNEIATKATEIQHRPWLLVNPKKNENTNNFFDIVKEDNSVCWKLSFVIQNKGATPATRITLPSVLNFRDQGNHDEDHPIELNNIILGQSEKYCYNFSMGGTAAPGEDIDELFQRFSSRAAPLTFKFIVSYEGLVSAETKYKTTVVYQINQDSVEVLDGEFK